jgi:putative inorganic carbon (hco3(-)) transporter
MTLGFLSLAAFFLLSVMRPAWALGLILSLLPTYLIRLKLINIPTTALELMVGVFLLAVLLTHAKEIWPRVRELGKLNWVICGFMAAAAISVFYSPETARALGQLKAFFVEPVLIFYASVIILKRPVELRSTLRALFISAVVISILGILQYWTHLYLPLRFWGYGLEVKRITSVFEYPNALALYLGPLVVFYLALWLKAYDLFPRIWMALGLVSMFTAVVLTYSRGAWLGVMAGVFILLLRKSGFSLKRWGTAAMIGLII